MAKAEARSRVRVLDRLSEAVSPTIRAVRSCVDLMSPSARRRFTLLSVAQAIFGLLDIVGIVLMGLVAAVLASGLDPKRMPAYVRTLLDATGLEGLTLIQAAAVLGATAVLVMLAKSVFGVILTGRLYRFLARQQSLVSERLATTFLAQPLLFVQRWSTAETQQALNGGVGLGVVIALGGVSAAGAEIALLMSVSIVLLVVDPLLSLLVAGVFVGAAFVLNWVYGRRTGRDAADFRDSTIELNTVIFDSLATYREAMVSDRRGYFARRIADTARVNATTHADMQYVLEVPKYLLEALLVVVAFGLAIQQLATREFPAAAGTVVLFLTAGFRLIPSMLRLQAAVTNLRRGVEGAQPTLSLAQAMGVDREGHSTATQPARHVGLRGESPGDHGSFAGDIHVEHVTFAYPGSRRPALIDVSLQAPQGASVALVGSTGAGKSTFADIVLGVIEPDSGVVSISGRRPTEVISTWPGAMAYVPQSVALVAGTVRDNVTLGLPRDAIDDEAVWAALEQAHLAEFLRSSRDGLDTLVGERGVHLSGGQRQRLGIARALFTQPVVLVMDEATSALDAETESTITQTLRRLEGKVTTITVAHRLATVRFADQLLFMRDGEIVARGSFEEVRAQEPDFARQAKLLGL